MESASIAAATTPTSDHHGPPAAERLLAGRGAVPRDAAFHHLRGHALRSVLHGLLLHPGRGRTTSGSRSTARSCRWRSPGVNTAILISSSFTMHWALEGARNENRNALQVGLLTTFLLGPHVPLGPDQRVRPHRLRAARQRPGHDLLRAHRPARRARVRRPDAAHVRDDPRVPRATSRAKEHRGVEVPGIYWHFVDVMWIVVYSTVYLL